MHERCSKISVLELVPIRQIRLDSHMERARIGLLQLRNTVPQAPGSRMTVICSNSVELELCEDDDDDLVDIGNVHDLCHVGEDDPRLISTVIMHFIPREAPSWSK